MRLQYSGIAKRQGIMVKSLWSVLLMYSRIPVPAVEWKDENRRYSLFLFPLIGVMVGALLLGWRWLCTRLGVGQFLFAVGAVSLPLIVTGCIHIDGFADVADARGAFTDPKRGLDILKDPRIGSFAAVKVCLYFLVQAALFSEMDNIRLLLPAALGYILSRIMSGLSAVRCKIARENSSLYDFVRPAVPQTGIILLLEALAVAVILMILDFRVGLLSLAGSGILLWYYTKMTKKCFGGITGDTCGWLVQNEELLMLGIAVISKYLLFS